MSNKPQANTERPEQNRKNYLKNEKAILKHEPKSQASPDKQRVISKLFGKFPADDNYDYKRGRL